MKAKTTLRNPSVIVKGKKRTAFQLSGKIVDCSTFIPLGNAEIYYSTDKILKSVLASEDGSFTLPDLNIAPGKELLMIIDYPGYTLHRIVLDHKQVTKASNKYTFDSQTLHCCLCIETN